MSGTLHGIGLGPGDPELVTLKAARLLRELPALAWPAVPGGESLARAIAAPHLGEGQVELRIDIPMAEGRAPAQAAYDLGAARIAETLEAGHDVGVLCEGDPLFYGSFMYLAARLSGRFRVQVVPGVTSVSAASAAAQLALVARTETLTILPATLPEEGLTRRLAAADSVAVMKVGRHLDRVRAALHRAGMAAGAVYVERATQAGETVLPLDQAPSPAPYFSIILATKGADPWARPQSS